MSLEALRVQAERERPRNNDELKQQIMQEMLDASPSVWRNVIMTNSEGDQIEFEVGNVSDVTTGTITTTNTEYTSTDATSWVITTFEELGADQPTAPDPFEGPCEEEMPQADSTVDGCFESSSPLRDEDDTDTMGLEHDPGAVGDAEQWFRNLRGDDEAPEANPFGDPPCSAECPSDACSPGCQRPVQDNACPQQFDCPSCGAPGATIDCGGPPAGSEDDACAVPF